MIMYLNLPWCSTWYEYFGRFLDVGTTKLEGHYFVIEIINYYGKIEL